MLKVNKIVLISYTIFKLIALMFLLKALTFFWSRLYSWLGSFKPTHRVFNCKISLILLTINTTCMHPIYNYTVIKCWFNQNTGLEEKSFWSTELKQSNLALFDKTEIKYIYLKHKCYMNSIELHQKIIVYNWIFVG